ncbi:amidohydrolase family protein [Paenibacillus senegalensis]|uniref:amidohydrolase family protein n=1 Tax=Paenibacillus senegalensis TaxID=1465766 RepID=UPI00028A1203|nr:amidohydrolase family protein [Paenibacillus senegalensis]
MKIIDAHCHVGSGLMNGLDAGLLLERMDASGVDQAVLVPWDQAIAVYNEDGNRHVLELVKRYPERFLAFCTVNPWYGTKALEELRRARALGASGLKLHPVYQGFQISDPIVIPVLEEAVRLQMPVYIPTGTPVAAMPLQLKYVAGLFPEALFIQGHFGSTDFWIDAVPSITDSPNIYIDTAYSMVSSIEQIIHLVGCERVVFSSDTPYLSLENEVAKLKDLDISEEEREAIASGNILRLLERGAG